MIAAFRRDESGVTAVETAIVTPVLLMLSLCAVDVSSLVARQNELQNAADVAAGAVLAARPDTAGKLGSLKKVVMASTGLESRNVDVSLAYRCGATAQYVTQAAACGTGIYTTYVKLDLHDRVKPKWLQLAVGRPVTLHVDRKAIAGQST